MKVAAQTPNPFKSVIVEAMTSQERFMLSRGFLLVASAARAMRLAHSTVVRWVYEDKVASIREGGRWYVRVDELIERVQPESPTWHELTRLKKIGQKMLKEELAR